MQFTSFAAMPIKLIALRIDPDYVFEPYLYLFEQQIQRKILSFHFRRDQIICFTSELLKHYYLASYLKLCPKEVKLAYNTYGRPYLFNHQNIDFNLTHSHNYVLMIIAYKLKVGIDIEKIDNQIKPLELSALVFSSSEQALIGNNIEYFFNLWSKKEALLKTLGCGFGSTNLQDTNLSLAHMEYYQGHHLISSSRFSGYSCCICCQIIPHVA